MISIRKQFLDKIANKESNIWVRNLFFISTAQFIAMVGMGSCVPFLPLFIRRLGITDPSEAKLWSGLIFAAPFMLSTITVPIWGALGDKYGRKLMIIRAIFGLAIAMTLMGFSQNIYQLFILRIVQGGVSGFIAASLAFVSADAPKERSGYAIGILQSALSAGNIFGPFFGGIISDLFGIRPVFFIVGACCLIGGILIIIFVKEKKKDEDENSSYKVMENIRFVLSKPAYLVIMVLIILSQCGIYFINPVFPFYIESLGAPKEYLSTITGVLVSMLGLFTIIFAPYWGRRTDKKDIRKTLVIALFVSGVAILLHTIAVNYLLIFPLRAVMGAFVAAIVPSLYSALSKSSSSHNKGGIMGLASSANFIGTMAGYLLCGFIASGFGMLYCFIFSAFFMFLATIIANKSKFLSKLNK